METVQELNKVYVQEIIPERFGLYQNDSKKKNVPIANYFNAGYFAKQADGSTVPVGNLAIDGRVIVQARDNAGWINVAKKQLTTLVTTSGGKAKIIRTDRLDNILSLKDAVSGIPVLLKGKQVSIEDIKKEGYDGSELYHTWHGFLGLREDKIVYFAAQCGYKQMYGIAAALGMRDAIKLDGGGSFILQNGAESVSTDENRRINNIGMWH